MHIRPYHPDDFDDLQEISRHIWEGSDYLPSVINDFVNNPHCHPFVVEDESRVVSIGNSNFFTEKWVWLQAMRTHPDYRGKGYGTKLTEYQQQKAKEMGAEETWLFTSTQNKATTRMLEKLEYEEVGRYKMWGFHQEVDEKDDNFDGTVDGKLVDLNYLELHTPEAIITLSLMWKPATIDTIRENLRSISDHADIPSLIVGEFECFPADSYFVPSMIENHQILVLDDPAAVMIFQPSTERDDEYNVGITCIDGRAVHAGFFYAYLHVLHHFEDADIDDPIQINVFYPDQVSYTLLDSDWKFRLMRKELL